MSAVLSSYLYDRQFQEGLENQLLLYLHGTPTTDLHLALQSASYGRWGDINRGCQATNQHRTAVSSDVHQADELLVEDATIKITKDPLSKTESLLKCFYSCFKGSRDKKSVRHKHKAGALWKSLLPTDGMIYKLLLLGFFIFVWENISIKV